MDNIKMTQAEMNNIIAEHRVLPDLYKDIPPTTTCLCKPGELFIVCSEQEKIDPTIYSCGLYRSSSDSMCNGRKAKANVQFISS